MSEQRLIATRARRNLSYLLGLVALVALCFAFYLFLLGIGAQETESTLEVFNVKVSAGSVGGSFLIVTLLAIWTTTKTAPKIQRD